MDLTWKICRVEDRPTAKLIGDLGADFIGLHLISESHYNRLGRYGLIEKDLQGTTTQPVIVTKETSPTQIAEVLDSTGCGILQLHCPVKPRDLSEIRDRCSSRGVEPPRFIVVLSAEDEESPNRADRFLNSQLDVGDEIVNYLIDTNWRGGTGRRASSDSVDALLHRLGPHRTLLAGGIGPDNADEIIEEFEPAGVDVQSGVEQEDTHKKDPGKLMDLARRCRENEVMESFRRPHRSLVSMALTKVSPDETNEAISASVTAGVDLVHLDVSDGSIAPELDTYPIGVARALRELSPCLPYDLHLFSHEERYWEESVQEFQNANPSLRLVYYHAPRPEALRLESGNPFFEVAREANVGFGVAIHAPQFEPEILKETLRTIGSDVWIHEFSLVTHSRRHSLDTVREHDLPLLQAIGRAAAEDNRKAHVSVDRDMNLEKLEILGGGRPSHVISGKFLRHSSEPTEDVAELKSLLSPPLGVSETGADYVAR